MRGCGSSEQAETKACLTGLHLMLEWIQQPTLVETDCLNLVQDDTRLSLVGLLLEIKAVASLLPECKYGHTHRDTNRVAHMLAQRMI
jgi:hypothetical protein